MKLGTETGSLVNHMYSKAGVGNITKGTPCTILCWSDRHPATVVEVKKSGNSKIVVVQVDSSVRIDKNGISESQSYEFSRNPNGAIYNFKVNESGVQAVRKNIDSGRWVKTNGNVMFGKREKYHDFTF